LDENCWTSAAAADYCKMHYGEEKRPKILKPVILLIESVTSQDRSGLLPLNLHPKADHELSNTSQISDVYHPSTPPPSPGSILWLGWKKNSRLRHDVLLWTPFLHSVPCAGLQEHWPHFAQHNDPRHFQKLDHDHTQSFAQYC
jgi:hypothetical protein